MGDNFLKVIFFRFFFFKIIDGSFFVVFMFLLNIEINWYLVFNIGIISVFFFFVIFFFCDGFDIVDFKNCKYIGVLFFSLL